MNISLKQFNRIALKNDLKKFLTKDGFFRFEIALKKDLEKILTKDEFYQFRVVLKEDLKNFVTKKELHQLKDEMLTGFDKIMAKLNNIELSLISNQVWHDRADRRIERLEEQCN